MVVKGEIEALLVVCKCSVCFFTSDDLEFFPQALCISNKENIAPLIDQLLGESRTKKNDLSKT